ncbi:MAG TPA: DUF2169 domain-containing protein, partial [Polyangiaceae bacterium]|nr:DUF2169 domain-containing protein [Polyangiaceae bacterium]
VFEQPIQTHFGIFPPDDFPTRTGCDLVVVASAYAPQPVEHMVVSVSAGRFQNHLMVVGDRIWEPRGGNGLAPSRPQPFREMPLDWTRAYGGKTQHEGLDISHPLNPVGRGFYPMIEAAIHRPLPNIENPHALIHKWDDRPLPVSWSPVSDGPTWQIATWVADRARRNQATPTTEEVMAQGYKCFPTPSTPAMLLPALAPGDPVHIDLGAYRIQFVVPDFRVGLEARVGRQIIRRRLEITGLWVFLPMRLVVFTFRATFRYKLRPKEGRHAVLDHYV